jgi:hypothetical protein
MAECSELEPVGSGQLTQRKKRSHNPSYFGGRDQKIKVRGQPLANSLQNPIWKKLTKKG